TLNFKIFKFTPPPPPPVKFLLGVLLTMLAIVGCDSKEAKEDDTQEKLMGRVIFIILKFGN
ncbi:MAG: hypothetical protein AAFQ01_00235, partial [Bacteroidota bacterium]